MKIIEEKNNRDPQGAWHEHSRPHTTNAARVTIARLRRWAVKDQSTISDMIYRIRTISTYPFND